MTGRRLALVALALAYAGLLATTTPFTTEADTLTAVALGGAAVVLVVQLARGPVAVDGAINGAGGGAATGSALPWLVLLVVAVAWELYCFFGGPRPAHPTLSTLYDLAARWTAVKAVLVLAWLAIGCELLR
jgi:hypothetical protein